MLEINILNKMVSPTKCERQIFDMQADLKFSLFVLNLSTTKNAA